MSPSIGIMLSLVLELVGLSAVPVPLYAKGATPALRVCKPLVGLACAFALSKFVGDYAGAAFVAGVAGGGFVMHRRWCLDNDKPSWLGATSPFLFRNPGQMKLWATLS